MSWHEESVARARRLWKQTERPPFAKLSRINALREMHGERPMTEEEYAEAKARYEAKLAREELR